MKGICLAGGLGTRLKPLTENNNKHLLPVYNRRMVEFPLNTLVNAGIKDIILVTGGKNPGSFLENFKNGNSFGIERLYYTYQKGAGGIVSALKMAKPFVGHGDSCVVVLGDNYFEKGIGEYFRDWNNKGAHVLLKGTNTPWEYGIAKIDDNKKIFDIKEKPLNCDFGFAIVGCYMFDFSLWEKISHIKPSERGELEITDLLRCYMDENSLSYSYYDGYWNDMGTFESWVEVSSRVFANKGQNGQTKE